MTAIGMLEGDGLSVPGTGTLSSKLKSPPSRFIANVEDPATVAGLIANPPGPSTSGLGPPQARRGGPPNVSGGPVAPAVLAPGTPPGGTAPSPAGRGGAGRGNAAAAHTPAYWIKVSAQQDGTFTVTNARNGFSKTYRPRN